MTLFVAISIFYETRRASFGCTALLLVACGSDRTERLGTTSPDGSADATSTELDGARAEHDRTAAIGDAADGFPVWLDARDASVIADSSLSSYASDARANTALEAGTLLGPCASGDASASSDRLTSCADLSTRFPADRSLLERLVATSWSSGCDPDPFAICTTVELRADGTFSWHLPRAR